MKNLQSPLALLLISCTGLGTLSCKVGYRSSYNFDYTGSTAQFSKRSEIAPEVLDIEITHRFGDVHVEQAAPGEAPAWSWELTTWSEDDARARYYMDQVSLETLQDASLLSFELFLPEAPGSDLKGIKSVLRLSVQPGTRIQLTNAHGDAHLNGLAGELVTDISHGDAHYGSLSGQVRLEHAHGLIAIDDLQAGSMDLRHSSLTGKGLHQRFEIDASHTSIDLSEVHGGLDLEASHSPSKFQGFQGALNFDGSHSKLHLSGDPSQIDLESSHGNLVLVCTGTNLNSLDADTKHSDFELFLPAGYDLQLNAKTDHGSAQNHLPSTPGGKPLRVRIDNSHGDFHLRPAGE